MDGSTAASQGVPKIVHDDNKGLQFLKGRRAHPMEGKVDLLADYEDLDSVRQKYNEWVYNEVPLNSYTVFRMEYSTPDHMDRSSRVQVVGPLAKEWIEQPAEKVMKKYAGSSLGPFFGLTQKVFPGNPLNALSKPKKMLASKLNKTGDDLLEELMEMYDSSASELTDSELEPPSHPHSPLDAGEESEESDVDPERFLSAQRRKKSFFGRTTWDEVGSSSRDKSKTFNNTVKDQGSFQGSRFARGKTTPEFARRGTGTFSDQLNAQPPVSPSRRGTFRLRGRSSSKGKSIMTDSDIEEEMRLPECLEDPIDVSTPIIKLPGFGSPKKEPPTSPKTAPPGVKVRDFSGHKEDDTAYKPPVGVLSQQPAGAALNSLRKYTGPNHETAHEKTENVSPLQKAPPKLKRAFTAPYNLGSESSTSDVPLFTQTSSQTSDTSHPVGSVGTVDSFHSAESSLESISDVNKINDFSDADSMSDADSLSEEFDSDLDNDHEPTVRGYDTYKKDPKGKSILVAPDRAKVLKGMGFQHSTSPSSPSSGVKFSGPEGLTPTQKLRWKEEQKLPELQEQDSLPETPQLMESSTDFGNNGQITPDTQKLINESTVADAPEGPEGQEPDQVKKDGDPTAPHTGHHHGNEPHGAHVMTPASVAAANAGPAQSDYYVQFQENFMNRAKTVAGKMRDKSTRTRDATVKNWRFLRDRTAGEIVRIEKMLVMVKTSPALHLPKDFNETETGDTRILERWREYIVVARSTGDPENPISLQFYSSRSIKAVEKVARGKTGAKMFLTLGKHTHVSLYSSLDKTIALWYSSKRETVIYILRARSAYSSIRWFAFFSEILGARRDKDMHVRVPDLAVVVTVRVSWRKFRLIDEYISRNLMATKSKSAKGAVLTARAHQYITEKALKALAQNPRFKSTVDDWVQNKRVGLGWRRYDRLEWVQGFGEQELHGSWALNRTHDLELRVKEHYGDKITIKGEELVEPTPIEGHLIRLKSWKGQLGGVFSSKKNSLGKLLYKNLYFSTHDHFLFFAKPGNAVLPLPDDDLKCQEAYNEEQREWVYEIAPFKSCEGTGEMKGQPIIKWLKPGITESEFQKKDSIALHNMQRRAAQIIKADGFINLLEVVEVRATERQEDIDCWIGRQDNNVDFDGSRILHGENSPGLGGEDGEVDSFDEDKTFELVMENGLIVRLQAYNLHCRNLWVNKLKELIAYWKIVAHNQLQVSADTRSNNMKRLYIDDKLDAAVGESSPKWETARASASTTLYNVSGISWSRSIIMKGMLFHKTRSHSTFKLYYAILCHGHLILYNVYRRTLGGIPVDKVDYERFRDIPLKEAYVYSGNIAESDILTRDEMSDLCSDKVVPRIYKDGWKSAESETLRCVILWFPRKKAVTTKSSTKLRTVNRLGVSGHRYIFVARSRQEKEQWVMALSHEIEKLVEPDFADINIVH
ncbi:Meiotically up-regulated gene 56 protein [Yarrowia sp. C11]|nr:Meiotically up-regulated gene 56 protein [Yarrowia sp. E02]KAG5369523.1 Meiotically up-regulated gene 56 protein [Yarrowia sp. C11]